MQIILLTTVQWGTEIEKGDYEPFDHIREWNGKSQCVPVADFDTGVLALVGNSTTCMANPSSTVPAWKLYAVGGALGGIIIIIILAVLGVFFFVRKPRIDQQQVGTEPQNRATDSSQVELPTRNPR